MIHGNSLKRRIVIFGTRSKTALAAVLLTVLSVVGCDTGAEPLDPATVNLSFSLPVAGTLLNHVDRVHIRISAQGQSTPLMDTTFSTTSAAGPFSFAVPLENSTEEVTAILELFGSGSLLFGGQTTASLLTGQTIAIDLQATPVPDHVVIEDEFPTFASIGDTVILKGAVVLATGDTIPGLIPTFTSSAPSVAEIFGENLLVSTGEGSGQVIATYEGKSDSAEFLVEAVVVGVQINPESLSVPLGTSTTVSADAQDANGNALVRDATWSIDKPEVATIDETGSVVPVSLGTAQIMVEVEGFPALANVEVVAGPGTGTPQQPAPIGTRVATLRGLVNPNGATTMAWFEWSTDESFASSTVTSPLVVSAGTTEKPISRAIKGLTPATTYFVRVRTSNSGGESVSEAISFDSKVPTGGFIEGRATVEGESLSGARITLSNASTTTTDASGKYAFEDVALGDYTVTISDYPADATFSPNSTSASVSTVGQVVNADFVGSFTRTSIITGTVTASGTGLSGITVALTGPDASSTVTNGGGQFTFTAIRSGSYNLSISGFDSDSVAFNSTSLNTAVSIGQTKIVSFPGVDLGIQTLDVYAFIGIDGTKPGVSALSGVTIDLYPTSASAAARTGRIGQEVTNSSGRARFVYDRGDDSGESGGASDNKVYSVVTGLPSGNFGVQADGEMTITYANTNINASAADTVDVLNGDVTLTFYAQTIATSYNGPGGSAMFKPSWITRAYTDTTGSVVSSSTTAPDGRAVHGYSVPVSSLPITYYFRLDNTQSAAASNVWTQAPEPQSGATAAGTYIRYVHDGTGPQTGVRNIGKTRITYVTQSIFAPVYHEADNANSNPRRSGGDNFNGVTAIRVTVSGGGTTRNKFAAAGNGHVVWNGVFNAQATLTVSAVSTDANIELVSQTSYTFGQPGGGSIGAFGPGAGGFRHSARLCPLSADTVIANCAAFAYKYNNTQISGNIQDGVPADVSGMTVALYSCRPPGTSSCNRDGRDDRTTTTNGSGNYAFTSLLEGIYEVVPDPASAGFASVTPGTAIVITAGNANSQTQSFTAAN